MPSLDKQALSFAVQYRNGAAALKRKGITDAHFDEEYRHVWRYITTCIDKHKAAPSSEVIEGRYRIRLPKVKKTDLGPISDSLCERKRYDDFIDLLTTAARSTHEPSDVDAAIRDTQLK